MPSHVFAHVRDADGLYHREVRLDDDGSLVIIGHDLGPGVERVYGEGRDEYEFERRVTPRSVARLLDTLEASGGEVLAVIAGRFDSSYALEKHLETHGIESVFWNRIGS